MTIVVGYVPRQEGLAALDAALAEVERTRERLVVVNACPDGVARGIGLADRRDIESMCSRLTGLGVDYEIHQPCRGLAPADELLQAVARSGARLVVVGLRGSRPLGSVPGSTVREVLTDADCDVLAVRPSGT